MGKCSRNITLKEEPLNLTRKGYIRENIWIGPIGEFLMENDMTVYIVIFDRAVYQISGKLFSDIAEYIDDHYVDEYTDSRRERLYKLKI